MGYKSYDQAPPPSIVKTPQLRWAGEKIVLEQDLYDFMHGGDNSKGQYIATFHLEAQSVGELSGAGGGMKYKETSEGDIWVWVDSEETIPKAILETEVQGEADINLKLYEAGGRSNPNDVNTWRLIAEPLVNYGFLVYFLAFEDVTLTDVDLGAIADITPEDTLVRLPVHDDVPVAVQVRGWFTSDELPGTTRVAVDVDGDGLYDMPAGRYVMPDDWWGLAGYDYDNRSNWDLMDSAHEDDIDSEDDTSMWWWGEEGPFNTDVVTTDPPGLAEKPTIGPFNTLQIWSTDMMWEASATVPTSDWWYSARNTVVPDGVMNPWDAPMPQALVDFEITGLENVNDADLSDLHKMELVGYGVNAVNGDLESPFYLMEIPSHMNIPANDYAWASWDGDGPYEMWHDLFVRDIDDMESGQGTSAANVNDDDVEVYSDNHGIAGVIADAIDEDGSVTIVATAEYPASLKRGKYPPVKSDEITIEWGIVEFDPDFEGIPRNCAEVEGCSVEFTNMTTGATTPYKYATWDFGDGTTPVQQTGAAAQAGQTITHQYAKAGVFDITLTMEDAEGVVAYQIEFDYIVVGEGGAGNSATWSFDDPGCFPKSRLLPQTPA